MVSDSLSNTGDGRTTVGSNSAMGVAVSIGIGLVIRGKGRVDS